MDLTFTSNLFYINFYNFVSWISFLLYITFYLHVSYTIMNDEWNGLCVCRIMGYGMVLGVYTAPRAVIWILYVKCGNLRQWKYYSKMSFLLFLAEYNKTLASFFEV